MKTKRLLLAVCLLLISATMLGTASFAWFSMNTEVNVDGIEIEAYSDSLFLEVSKDGSVYETAVTLDGEKQYLRVAKHDFVAEAYTVTPTEIVVNDSYYNGAEYTYYKKVELEDSLEKFVFADAELEVGTPLAGYYKNLVFTRVDTENATYAATNNVTYYKLVGSKYEALTLDEGDLVEGYYTLTAKEAETTGNYDGTGTYYKKVRNDYSVVTLEKGTNLKGYYTLNATAIADLTNVTGKAYVRNAITVDSETYYEYSLVADLTSAGDITDLLYFGRTYSDVIDNGNVNGTLNVIEEDELAAYRYVNKFYLRNAKNTNDSRNLQAIFTVGGEDDNMAAALRVVLVASIDGEVVNVVTYDNGENSTDYKNGTNIVNLLKGTGADVSTAEVVEVDVYVYYDGTDEVSNNATNGVALLGGQTVSIKFTIDGLSYN